MKRGQRRGVSVISCSAEHECLLLRSSGKRRREAASDTSLLLPVLLAQLTSHTGLHRWTRARLLPHKRSLFPLNPLAHPDAAAPMILAASRTLAGAASVKAPRRWRRVTVPPHNLFTLKLRLLAKAALNKCQPPRVGKQF